MSSNLTYTMSQENKVDTDSPQAFMRSIRPERYSDSFVAEVSELDRSLLEYHLDSLTSRNQHLEFESFARKLVRAEICPNVSGQTGPAGGGDSKVDSETYPVAEELSWNWIVGNGSASASERWAFAFSAKKDFAPKLKSDIKKIAETERGYKKAFFVTNQFVPDKKKSKLEDDLTKVHKIDVRVLDRTWILDRVFENSRQDLAIEELGVSAAVRQQKQVGPRDFERNLRLDEIEKRINKAIEETQISASFIDDLSLAASLSRSLELPKIETAGRLARTVQYANQYGTAHQKIRSLYDQMWTNVFWFNNAAENLQLYPKLEELVADSRTACDWGLLVSQWQVLSVNTGDIDAIKAYAAKLLKGLSVLSSDETSPCNSLYAQSLKLSVELSLSNGKPAKLEAIFRAYRAVASQAGELIGFPLDSMVKCLGAVSGLVSQSEEFNLLHEELVELVSKREGEIAGAELLLERGKRQMDSKLYADSIRSFGKAFGKLYKNETQDLLGYSLFLCGCAYEKLGLYWAARGSILWAISVSINETWKRNEVSPFVVGCLLNLKWIELRLGRLPEILAWQEFLQTVRMFVGKEKSDSIESAKDFHNFDAVLAILLLKTDFWDLKHLEKLPDRLAELCLDVSCDSLLYALGQPSDLQSLFEDKGDDPQKMFLALRDQPAAKDMTSMPLLCNTVNGVLNSKVLGCEIDTTFRNSAPFVDVAESLLAALEAAFATGMADGFFSSEPKAWIEIRKVDFGENMSFEFIENSDQVHCVVKCLEFEIGSISSDEHEAIRQTICKLILEFGLRTLLINESQLNDLFGRDLALSRAATFSCSMQAAIQTIGTDRTERGWKWADEPAYTAYPCLLSKEWDHDSPPEKDLSQRFKMGDASSRPSRDGERKIQDRSHAGMEILSLIRTNLWSEATWVAMCFLNFPEQPPILGFVFENEDPAAKIFEHWRNELNDQDQHELLRLTIIRGVSAENPKHYRIVVGTNVENYTFDEQPSSIISPSRVHTMRPNTEENLDNFLQAYETYGCYGILPAISNEDEFPSLLNMQPILKHKLNVKNAWEVEIGEMDAVGILPDDQVIVPDEVDEPPIKKLLAWLNSTPSERRDMR